MKKCLIYLEADNLRAGKDLLEVARQLYSTDSDSAEKIETYGVMIGEETSTIDGFFDYIIKVKDENLRNYDIQAVTEMMTAICETYEFDAILIPSSWQGRMLAPRLAICLHTGLTADVTEIRHIDGVTQLVRPAYSGRLLAGIVNTSTGPIMMSVRQNVFHYRQAMNRVTQYIDYYHQVKTSGIQEVKREDKVVSYDIRESEVLVAGGGGVSQGFEQLTELADLLGGQVAASRKIVDSGIAKRQIQVGQSGKTVSPKFYLALGIYGSIQHVEGLKNVKYMISVNTNRHAPICSLSDIVVEGDGNLFVKLLIERIKRYESEKNNK